MGREIATRAPVGLRIQVGQRQWVVAPGSSLTIGREPDADVSLHHPQVSRQHARLWCDETGWVLEDTGSRNGTFVDGVLITQMRITGPVQIHCGDPEAGAVLEVAPVRAPVTGTGLFEAIIPPNPNGGPVDDATLAASQLRAVPRPGPLPVVPVAVMPVADPVFLWHGADRLDTGDAVPSIAAPSDPPTASPAQPVPMPDGPVSYDPLRPLPPPRPLDLADDPDEAAPAAIDSGATETARAGHVLSLVLGVAALLSFMAGVNPAVWVLLFGTAVGAFILASLPHRLHREQVIDRWDTLIVGGQGRAEVVVADTLVELERLALPNLAHREAQLAAGVRASLRGRTRPFLIVSQTANGRLKPYRMYVNVRDYGETLQTSWFLAYQPRPWQRVRDRSVLGLDLFDEQDLRAYVTAVHRCFVSAVIDLLVALDQDTSKIDRTSKGFLGIS